MTQPILLLDVMSTIVYDPFLVELPAFFNMSFLELIQDKDPSAWPRFERGEIDEHTFWREFFIDRRQVDIQGLRQTLKAAYRFVPGMEKLLADLHQQHIPMHTLSNYPSWWQMIEDKLALSQYLKWTFVSCHIGLRKPNPAIYLHAAQHLGVPPKQCVFVDDRQSNCDAAISVGMRAIKYHGADPLRMTLKKMGIG